MIETRNAGRSTRRRPLVVPVGLALLFITAGCASGLTFGADSTDGAVVNVGVVGTADGMVSTGDGTVSTGDGAATVARPLTDPAELAKLVDFPGDPVGVWYWSVPVGIVNGNDRVPGPTDYLFYAIVEYPTPEAAAEAAGPEVSTDEYVIDEIVIDDWYPQELIELGHTGEWDRSWLSVSVHQPEPAWTDPVYVVDGAPRYVVFNYAEPTS